MSYRLQREQLVHAPVEEVFAFFAHSRNLEALTPPWLRFAVLTPEPIHMQVDTLIDYRLRLHGIPVRWRTRIAEWQPPQRFIDVQLRGPYRSWHHTHEFSPHPDGTLMRDTVRYELPLGVLGRVVHAAFVRADLARIFYYRRTQIARLSEREPWGSADGI